MSNGKLPGLTRKDGDESLISGTQYVARLRAQHAKMNPGTDWARLDSQSRNDGLSDEENGTVLARGYKNDKAFDDILRTNEDLVVKSQAKLLPGLLEYSKLVDANAEDPSNGPINSVQFHQNAPVSKTKELIGTLKMNGTVRSLAFADDGQQLLSHGGDGQVYPWDLRTRACIHKAVDDG
ncbi:hypothetical protein NC653_005456 [Populus alba x Populus x berolinensis]|uniref:Uncharacterized protein n=1 Tax=Populus alba x Populus x berolinensis TaxID=444605 RepID=A0AAD6RBY4_9ROSI|nr:hypothetical protein NC653_005456 [Populus alba x Populus x berolinensis]